MQRVEAFTRGPVQMEATKGGQFSLLGGSVTGEFTELVSALYASMHMIVDVGVW